LVAADVGDTIRVVVTATNSAGSAKANSAQTGVVAASASAPVNTALPTVSGSAVQGSTLTESDGSWSGSPAPTFTRQWQRCTSATVCADISGATGTSYVLVAADVGDTIRVVVTATNSAGSAKANSAQTGVVAASGSSVTLGNTVVGAASNPGWDGVKWGNKYTLASAGTVTKVSAYLGDNPGVAGVESFRALVYADASGAPGALVAQSSVVSVGDGQAAGWVDFAISPGVSLSAGAYWVVLQGGGTNNAALRYGNNAVTGAERWNNDAFADGPASPFGTATTGNWQWSLYATVTIP
jgi:hypothetical protein